MEAAKQIERQYEQQANRSSWADPTTVSFEERADGKFEVYADDHRGDTYLLGFEDVGEAVEYADVDEMLKERGLREHEITEMHRQEMAKRAEMEREGRLKWQILERVERTAPGFEGYMQDGERLVFTGRRNRAMRGMPTGISPNMLDEHDKRRLKQEVDMRMTAQEGELVAVMGKNCVVVDTRFDIGGEMKRRLRGETEVLNAPIEELRSMGVEPSEAFVVDQQNAKTLFISEGDYYYRGSLSESASDPYADGWIAALDQPVETVTEVLNEAVRPDSVIAAEQADLDVKRQGDWFFIEQHDDFMPTGIVRTPELQPDGECDFLQNHAAEWLGMDALNPSRVFVKGEVTHLNDDHETMDLGDEWFTAQHNGVESRSFECEEFDATTQDRGMYSHPESHGGLL
jgi:hypothetical protein